MASSGAERLEALAHMFKQLKRQRPQLTPGLKRLTQGKEVRTDPGIIRRESKHHVSITNKMLGLIDRYAALHRKVHGNVRLTKEMASELNRLAIHVRVALHPRLPRRLADVVRKHHEGQAQLFSRAERIRAEHEILVARVHG